MNILHIAIDDMNDWVGPLGGYDGAITPNLDRLAKMGMTFTNAHCTSPACHSSRVANMTGVRPSRSGIVKNVFNKTPGPSWRDNPLMRDVTTLSQHFRNSGYKAMGGGKIYHSLQWGPYSENDPATWDEYFPDANAPIPHQIRSPELVYNPPHFIGRRHSFFTWGEIPEEDEAMSDYKVASWAISQLEKKHDKPFFLAAGIFRPHMPWEVPQKYFDMYPISEIKKLPYREDDLIDAHDHGRRKWHVFVEMNKEWPRVIQSYLASITFADAQVGRILDALEKSDYKDNTIITLWSDHGMHIGEKENWEKFTLWEESTRIPMFVVAPGVTKPGSVCKRPTSALDIYPTLVELTGTKAPGHLDGESLVPLLKNPDAERIQPAITNFKSGDSVRTERYRYIRYNSTTLEELYDHQSDPNEFTNLAYDPSYAKVLKSHRKELEKYCGRKAPEAIEPPADYEMHGTDRIRKKEFVYLKEMVKETLEKIQEE